MYWVAESNRWLQGRAVPEAHESKYTKWTIDYQSIGPEGTTIGR